MRFKLFFILIIVSQVILRREDWPFSQFGMYQGRLESRNIYRFDVDVVDPTTTERTSLFSTGIGGFYIYHKLNEIILKRKKMNNNVVVDQGLLIQDQNYVLGTEVVHKLDDFFRQRIGPQLKKMTIFKPRTTLVLRYRFWKIFENSNIARPDLDIDIYKTEYSKIFADSEDEKQ